MFIQIVTILAVLALLGALLYWLLVITEGVFLGRRVVVWLYDLTARRYDAIKQFDPTAESYFVIRPLLRRLSLRPAPLILDVATGTGRVPFFVLEEPVFNGRVIGLDASAAMLAQAAAKLAPFGHRVMLIQQTAVWLPLATNTVDAVTCLESLEFLPSDEAALREMARVLRPGGTLMTTRRRGWEAQTFVGRYRSPEQFTRFLESLGLTDIEIRPWQVEYDLVLGYKN